MEFSTHLNRTPLLLCSSVGKNLLIEVDPGPPKRYQCGPKTYANQIWGQLGGGNLVKMAKAASKPGFESKPGFWQKREFSKCSRAFFLPKNLPIEILGKLLTEFLCTNNVSPQKAFLVEGSRAPNSSKTTFLAQKWPFWPPKKLAKAVSNLVRVILDSTWPYGTKKNSKNNPPLTPKH